MKVKGLFVCFGFFTEHNLDFITATNDSLDITLFIYIVCHHLFVSLGLSFLVSQFICLSVCQLIHMFDFF